MARHIRAALIEATPRPVVAVGNDYPAGHEHPAHSHRRSQLLFAEHGTMLVRTAQERQVLDQVARLFERVDCGVTGPEGNYRQRLYSLKCYLTELELSQEHVPQEHAPQERQFLAA